MKQHVTNVEMLMLIVIVSNVANFCVQNVFNNTMNWITGHQSITVDEVVNAAYEIPRDKPDPTNVCEVHSEPLKIFCETCDKLICHIMYSSKETQGT